MRHWDEGRSSKSLPLNITNRLSNPVWIRPVFGRCSFHIQAGSINRVWITPIWIPRALTINEAYFWLATASAGQNARIGLYADNGNTPVDGRLLYDSGNIGTGVVGLKGGVMAPLNLPRGLVWAALATSDGVMSFYRESASAWCALSIPNFDGCHYTLGAWGALTNPCPAVNANANAKQVMFFHVASIDE